MKPAEITTTNTTTISPADLRAAEIGLRILSGGADQAADRATFGDYISRKAENTIAAQRHDLEAFAVLLPRLAAAVLDEADAGRIEISAAEREGLRAVAAGAELVSGYTLQTTPAAWQPITYGLITMFRQQMIADGYTISTINRRLATIRTYTKLARRAGAIDAEQADRIRLVSGYTPNEAPRIDERRTRTRRDGTKKAAARFLTRDQVKRLIAQPDTPQGRRDALLVALMVELGCRVGEATRIEARGVDLDANTIRFYRPKVGLWQTLVMTPTLRRQMIAYMQRDGAELAPTDPIIRGSRKGGALTGPGMTEIAATVRIKTLAAAIGADGIAAHDLRHTWADANAWRGLDWLIKAGGWKDARMPMAYIDRSRIANPGADLED